jgi:peptidoglycan hydrolase-like protein with peptidoglycan-binding domain
MLKIIGIILAVIILVRIVFGPAHNFINDLIQDNKAGSEEQIIGLLSRHNSKVEELQRILKDADFDPGSVDGMMGAQTRGAIREFQKANQLRATGKIDTATWSALTREKEVLHGEQKMSIPVERVTPEANVTVNNGNLNPVEENVVKKIKLHSEVIGRHLKTKDRIRQIQAALKKAGFYQGSVDGKIGPKTKEAIIKFQKANGLKADGIVGESTSAELNEYLSR